MHTAFYTQLNRTSNHERGPTSLSLSLLEDFELFPVFASGFVVKTTFILSHIPYTLSFKFNISILFLNLLRLRIALVEKMKQVNKACILITLGAAFGLEAHMIVSKSLAFRQNWSTFGSSRTQARVLPSAFDASKETDGKPSSYKQAAAEEPIRIVAYLSCWGPY